jgi:glutamate synthase (NADPH/NADH) small chain
MSTPFSIGDTLSFIKQARNPAHKRQADSRSHDFDEIYLDNDKDQLIKQADRCLDCGNPYCEWQCPLHNFIPNWLDMVAYGQFEQAASLMHATNPLPEICGRVCPQDRLCEQACTLNTGFGAVTIGAIEKNIADQALANNWRPDLSAVKQIRKKVAIIGAGPAGLGCAELLVRNGVKAVVYDKYPEIGGLLTFGIPAFKLEKSIIAKRRVFLQDIGIEFRLNTEVGQDLSISQLQQQYDSLFLAMGTYQTVDGNLAGRQQGNVIQSLDYLIGNINQQQNYQMDNQYYDLKDQHVLVLGGGDTAMDCVRSAIRQQAKSVSCVYRKDQAAMPGSRTEIVNAKEEGVKFIFNLQPTEITAEGVVFDRSDFNPLKHKDKTVFLSADKIILAFGFRASPAEWFKQAKVKTRDSGLIATNKQLQTSNSHIYAGGDMVTGADLVVTAIAQGREAARQILAEFGVVDG